MEIAFQKYQAAGNDFVIIDNRMNHFPKEISVISKICDRHFGIGSDGLILIEKSETEEFEMVFYNPDGSQSLCGNGSRAAVKFAESLKLVSTNTSFKAFDGSHKAQLLSNSIRIQLADTQNGRPIEGGIFIDTGSPHFVLFVDDVQQLDVVSLGRKWRFSELFGDEGANINFVEVKDKHNIFVRTYERGVENETLSCGTGVTAAALVSSSQACNSPLAIETKGGALKVSYIKTANGYEQIWLEGPAEPVFSGTINL